MVLPDTNNFKLLWYTEADGENHLILRNITITVPLMHLINFWRSLEMPLINRKVELKLKWTNHSVLSPIGADTVATKINYKKLLAKDLKDQCIGNNKKWK